MAWNFILWAWGNPLQTRWLPDDKPAPDPSAYPIDARSGNDLSLRQHDLSNAHYGARRLQFDVPAASVRYKDFIAPDYTKGVDILAFHWNTAGWVTGDKIVCGKLLIGKIGVVAVEAAQGATEVTLASTLGVLVTTKLGGALDEGFHLSFGVEASTDASINAGPPSGDEGNPDQELREYEIKRVGAETDIGGESWMTTVTLFTGLAAAVAANTDVNLVVRFLRDPIEVVAGDLYDFGRETLRGGNLPAGKRGRLGVRNTDLAIQRTVRAVVSTLY